ncbi:MAG TPA: alpha/beta fold hydrolase, partial [Vicinamibacteria bacterium]|nr:alpha/beta fold hydrolase [Vicinamibacteria bacterium]
MKARIAGVDLEYEARGRGRALLLLHAFPLNRTMWDAQVEALAARHQVVRFDCRGFGGSPPGDALLTMERIADDAAAVLDRLGISQAVVAGCSMGGYAALAFARRHP